MFRWLRRRRTPEPLVGGPSSPRLKNYAARSGYVYEYVFRGRRPSCGEYVFEVNPGRKGSYDVSVIVEESVVRKWEAQHCRELTSTERYAVAKMALFQAFDEREGPDEMRRHRVVVREIDLEAILERLGID